MKIKVLVVDDSPFIHRAMVRVLPEDTYEICGIGKNGQEGVELYQSLAPDVVTMDFTMPLMDGLEAAREILKTDPEARIVMMSSLGDEKKVREAKASGIRMLLKKPFKAPELIAVLNKALAVDNGSDEEDVSRQEDGCFEYFSTAMRDALKSMADLDCSFGEKAEQQDVLEPEGLVVILGVTGNMSGRVILNTSRQVADKLYSIISGSGHAPGGDPALFSLAEFLSVLSVNAISLINKTHKGSNLRLSPPSVFVGKHLEIRSPKVRAEIIKADTGAGEMYLSVGFEGVVDRTDARMLSP
jgi:DNA-binding NarL/FixJ family response regulator